MEWIDFKEKKPETDIMAVVGNDKGYMIGMVFATYRY